MNMPVEVKADVSESANNLMAKPSKSLGNVVATVIDYFHNKWLLPMQEYNIVTKHNLQQFEEDLKDKVNQIPEDKQAEPSINIWGQTMDSLKWNMDDEQKHIRDMFTNILASDVNSDTKSKVQPAFIEIVRQMSREDAKLLADLVAVSTIFNIYEERVYIRKIGEPKPQEYFPIRRYICALSGHEEKDSLYDGDFEISLDNLKRLGIVAESNGYYGEWKRAKKLEKNGEWSKFENDESCESVTDITQNGSMEVTAFGKQFIQICLK